jgi:NADH-quinone oxidoreductase subunit E
MTINETTDCAGRQFVKVCDILDRHERRASNLVPILQAVQEEYRYLPREVLTYVATALDVSPARVFGVATFYAHFAITPKGKHIVKLCDGTACHVKDSIPILEAIRKRLGLVNGQKTTPDLLFTVETVACLGACGLAPVVVMDETVHGQQTPESAVKLVEEVIAKEQS